MDLRQLHRLPERRRRVEAPRAARRSGPRGSGRRSEATGAARGCATHALSPGPCGGRRGGSTDTARSAGTGGHSEPGGVRLGARLERFRLEHGLPRVPRQVIYTRSGALDIDARMFNIPGVEVVVVTTGHGARHLRELGCEAKGVRLLVAGEDTLGARELRHAHELLFRDLGVRYLDCEGGETILEALRAADLVDEIFVTTSDVVIDPSQHEGVKRLDPTPGARLIGEGRVAADPGYVFRRWRHHER